MSHFTMIYKYIRLSLNIARDHSFGFLSKLHISFDFTMGAVVTTYL